MIDTVDNYSAQVFCNQKEMASRFVLVTVSLLFPRIRFRGISSISEKWSVAEKGVKKLVVPFHMRLVD